MSPKVSIIVPVYGVERYIERCAVSLFEQTYSNIEYVFVNDATKDKSIDILEQVIARYPARQKDVRIITHPQNKGISATRNTGLLATTGDYIFYVDSDDYLAHEAITHLVHHAEKTKADIVLFDTNIITLKGIRIARVRFENKEHYIKNLLHHTANCAHWNKFYNASFYKATNVLADERVRFADDYVVTPRLVHQAQRISVLHEPLYFYETTNQSSYVHNLKRAAVESQYLADTIVINYFAHVTDAASYADILAVLPQRSMVSLAKNTNKEGWRLICSVYSNTCSASGKGLTFINLLIFRLLQRQQFTCLDYLMRLYHCLC